MNFAFDFFLSLNSLITDMLELHHLIEVNFILLKKIIFNLQLAMHKK